MDKPVAAAKPRAANKNIKIFFIVINFFILLKASYFVEKLRAKKKIKLFKIVIKFFTLTFFFFFCFMSKPRAANKKYSKTFLSNQCF